VRVTARPSGGGHHYSLALLVDHFRSVSVSVVELNIKKQRRGRDSASAVDIKSQ